MILTCDRRYYTLDLKKNNKTIYWRSNFLISKIKTSLKNSKSGQKKTKIWFLKMFFLLLKYQKLLTFLVKNPKKKLLCFFLCFYMESPTWHVLWALLTSDLTVYLNWPWLAKPIALIDPLYSLTEHPLFWKNRPTGSGNPTFESYVEGKAL